MNLISKDFKNNETLDSKITLIYNKVRFFNFDR